MPSAEEKQRRKEIAKQLKATQAAFLLASMPLRSSQLKELFSYLESKLTAEGCHDTLYYTEQFALEANIPFEGMKAWLGTQGGYCDCEVLANVEEKFEGLI